uniref:Tetratricopeptide repeat protein n=1 Tax=candidate division WOR-3 bacterium TaxID=2052148 RepID=A0A7V0Z7I0_UNCW3
MEKRLDEIKELIKNSISFEIQGKYKDAIHLLEKAIKLNPKDGNLYNRLGDLYLKLNKTKEAIETYQAGIEAFRADNFLRNALALCKKILRYDHGNAEINFTIAQLLIDLDEKGDAAIYLFTYIERQMAQGNKKEVMKAMEILKNLKLSDSSVANKMAKIYDKVGEKKKAEEVKKETPEPAQEQIPETSISTVDLQPIIEEVKTESHSQKPIVNIESLDRLEKISDEIERVTVELRKAMRIDEVIVAIDKSLNIFSQQQKEAITLLHRSLNTDLVNLQKAISNLQESSKRNLEDVARIVTTLERSISEINKSQNLIVDEITKNLNSIGGQFESTTRKMLEDLRNLTSCYESASKDVCTKVDENRQITSSLLKVGGETKIGIQTINDSLLKFFLNQDIQIKKLNKFILIMSIMLGGITTLLLLILLLK